MSISEFIQAMVEAGMKTERGFEIVNQQDETVEELREQRRELKRERDECRQQLEKARERLADRERETVHEFVTAKSPTGVEFESIVSHVRETAPDRVTTHLDALEGDQIQRNPNDGTWFAIEEGMD
ncbi:hypothetical protein [Natrinema sp. SYSU A 869]|uniref:hypothetical protein n=1 Tax=Natrinema sp. SYSU A 869 TaxID=2871694 RepID=UPI001CA41191|nr:hypothetical protein [Natrinema sp. SYSU A 869]